MLNGFQIGSVSHGTLRTENLLSAFADELERLLDANPETNPGNWYDLIQEANDILDTETEEIIAMVLVGSTELVSDLQDALDELAPDYCYFGPTERDGSDFGFWPAWGSIEAAVRDGELLKLNAGDEISGDWYGPVMFVTDHGNVTMGYTVPSFVETWSCV